MSTLLKGKGAFAGDAPKTRKKARTQTFSSYIYKVLKQVHPDLGISKKAMAIMDSFVRDTFDRISTETKRLAKKTSKKATLTSREVQTAVRLLLPGELAKHAVIEGNKADTTYEQFLEGNYDTDVKAAMVASAAKIAKAKAKAKSKGKAVEDTKKPKISKSDASGGLKFPVGRILSLIKKNKGLASRVGVNAGIYLSAVLEYIASEIFDLAIKAAKDRKKKKTETEKNDGKQKKESEGYRITCRHLKLAIVGDEELKVLFKDTTIPSAGVVDNIHKALLPKMSAEAKPAGSKKSKQIRPLKTRVVFEGKKTRFDEEGELIVEKVMDAVSAKSLQNPAQNAQIVAALEVATESASPKQAAAIEAAISSIEQINRSSSDKQAERAADAVVNVLETVVKTPRKTEVQNLDRKDWAPKQ